MLKDGPIVSGPGVQAGQILGANRTAGSASAAGGPAANPLTAGDARSTGAVPSGHAASAVQLNGDTTQAAPQPDPLAPFLDDAHPDAAGRPRVVHADQSPYLGHELYLDPDSGTFYDGRGQAVDLTKLTPPETVDTAKLRKLVSTIQTAGAVAGSAVAVGSDVYWYRRTIAGMQHRLPKLEGKIADRRAAGEAAGFRYNRMVRQAGNIRHELRLANMNVVTEQRYLSLRRYAQLTRQSRAFAKGEGVINRTPVGKALESRRQVRIQELRQELKAGAIPKNASPEQVAKAMAAREKAVTVWTRLSNVTRGRILPSLLAVGSGYMAYRDINETVRTWDAPSNRRKWDDVLRGAGGVVSTGAAVAALSRRNVTAAVFVHAGGSIASAIGSAFKDNDLPPEVFKK